MTSVIVCVIVCPVVNYLLEIVIMDIHDIRSLATKHGLQCHSEDQALALGRFLRDAVESQVAVKIQSMADAEEGWDVARWAGLVDCLNVIRKPFALF